VYLNLQAHLRDKLVKQIDTLPLDQLDKMLEVTFPYIVYEELREVHLAILKRHPNIPQPFLRQLGTNSDLYAILPLQVQRQIWQVCLSYFTVIQTDILFRLMRICLGTEYSRC